RAALSSEVGGAYELSTVSYPSIQPFSQQRTLASLLSENYISTENETRAVASNIINAATDESIRLGANEVVPLDEGLVTDFVVSTELLAVDTTCGFEMFSGPDQDPLLVLVIEDGGVLVVRGDTILLTADHLGSLPPDGISFVAVNEAGTLTLFLGGRYAGRLTDLEAEAGQVSLIASDECIAEDAWLLDLNPDETLAVTVDDDDVSDTTSDATEAVAEDLVLAYSSQAVNVRSGDGTAFGVVGSLLPDEPAEVIGISSTGSGWYRVELQSGARGWVAPSVVRVEGDVSSLFLIDPPSPPQQAAAPQPTAAPVDDDTTVVEGEVTPAPDTDTATGDTDTVEAGSDTDTAVIDPANITPEIDATVPTLPYDCSNFVGLEPSGGLSNGTNFFSWTAAPGVDSYWISVFNEDGTQTALANVPATSTTARIEILFEPSDTLFQSWQVTAQFGDIIVCGTPFITVPRGF
ncbi:MAG: SH3 domain-containing protein, partial [Chloroflexota bacterium]